MPICQYLGQGSALANADGVAQEAAVDPSRVRTSLGQPVQIHSLEGVCPMQGHVGFEEAWFWDGC